MRLTKTSRIRIDGTRKPTNYQIKKKLLNEFNENTANADITKVEIVVDIDEF